ncbi:DUF2973 domain-containing protein [Synechococcus sp. UW179A]|uniref:DUF2973 domain-containing protein n=1 Tax=Synechococcus sp. UW179A TaxID=2575510 RepID=UPI000E0F9919|nr:DUF2973 domain-containing protein [Synechococcus sp. UW179A]
MLTSFLPLVYTAACAFVFLSGFRILFRALRHQTKNSDRTGLRTTHPELLDENGFITNEKLLVVHFGGLDDHAFSPNS